MFTIVISKAQKNVYLTIKNKLGSSDFAFNQASQNDLAQNFKVSRLDYYISSIVVIHDGGQQLPITNKYLLVKCNSNVSELIGALNVTSVEGIKFSIGVEAPTNNADPTQWTAPHPLAPQSPSMHWGWTAGYRFVAIEGKAGNNFNTDFQMHGLGNQNHFNQTHITGGTTVNNNIYINLDADYSKALKTININAGPIDHGVDATDLVVLQNFRDNVFTVGSGLPTSVRDITILSNVVLYPNPTKSSFTIDFTQSNTAVTKVVITDLLGRVVKSIPITSTLINESIENQGIYILQFIDKDLIVGQKKVVIE